MMGTFGLSLSHCHKELRCCLATKNEVYIAHYFVIICTFNTGADLGGGPRGPGPPPHGHTHSIMHMHTPSGTVCKLVVTQIVTGQPS